MDKQLSEAALQIGDKVRVKDGCKVPDSPDVPMDGWVGTVMDAYPHNDSHVFKIKWTERTLDGMPIVYQRWCEQKGYKWDAIWLSKDDLEPNVADAVKMVAHGERCS